MAAFKPGDRVLVPWAPGNVNGTVVSLLGNQIARVAIELPGEDELPDVKVIPVRIELLQAA